MSDNDNEEEAFEQEEVASGKIIGGLDHMPSPNTQMNAQVGT